MQKQNKQKQNKQKQKKQKQKKKTKKESTIFHDGQKFFVSSSSLNVLLTFTPEEWGSNYKHTKSLCLFSLSLSLCLSLSLSVS